jgi:uncharacterized protein (DUF58 family)
MSGPPAIRRAIDWGELTPLRIRAREVSEGLYSGLHRSALRGAGVEFGGFREYVSGDDLRWLDRRALLRHDRLVVRQFETETDRALCLVVDASASMAFRGPTAPGAKFAFAAVIAAALARVAIGNGDPVSLTIAGGAGTRSSDVGRAGGREQFERIVAALETVEPGGDALANPTLLDAPLQALARTATRGSIVVVLSDLLDWPPDAADRVAGLASGGRVLVVLQTLDAAEADFPFSGTVRLRGLEGGAIVETDADVTREAYLKALAALTESWQSAIVHRGGRFLRATSSVPPLAVVRDVVKAVR